MPESFDGFRLTTPTEKAVPFLYSTGDLRPQGTIRNGRINLIMLSGLNCSDRNVIFQLFEDAPELEAVPVWVVAVPKRGQFSWVPAQGGRVFSRLYWAVSSTVDVYTPTTDKFWVDAEGVLV